MEEQMDGMSEQIENQGQDNIEASGTETQFAPENYDWTTDKRYSQMWKEDANELYKSYRNMEKTYNPLKSQIDSFNELAKTYNVSPDKFGDVLKEYQTYKDPNAPQNQWFNYIQGWINDEKYQPKFMEAMQALENQKRIDRWGENTPPEIIDKLEELERFKQAQQEREQHEAHQQAVNEASSVINQQLGVIENMAKQYGLNWNDEMRDQVINYALENNIEPRYMSAVFAQYALQAVQESTKQKAEQQVAQNIERNKKAGIIATNTAPSKPSSDSWQSFREKFLADFGT